MKLIVQPYQDKLGNLLMDDLKSGKYNHFSFFVAYARISGVDVLYDDLLAFRAAGGLVHAVIGIDQKNTSFEALRAVLGMAEDLFVFHNHDSSSTFHPKIYLLKGERHGRVYVGSNNLTSGGLYLNYEVASCEDFDLTVPERAENYANIVRALKAFCQEGSCCKKASEALIREWYDAHLLCSENEIREMNKKTADTKTVKTAGGSGKAALFGTEPIAGKARKHDFNYLAPETTIREEYRSPAVKAGDTTVAPAADAKDDGMVKSFYKRLSGNDVDLKSSPGQIIIPILYKSFFEPLSEPKQTPKGAMQSERYFKVKYENSGEVVENARVIFYVPAPFHPRKNSEVRFALRNREIFKTFQKGDVLLFKRAPRSCREQYLCTVTRIPHDSAEAAQYPGRFAWIAE